MSKNTKEGEEEGTLIINKVARQLFYLSSHDPWIEWIQKQMQMRERKKRK